MKGKQILAIILLLMILMPFIYSVAEASHECMDGDCLICENLTECETLIRHISTILMSYGNMIIFIGIVFISAFIGYKYIHITITPILWKIRIND